MSIKSLSELNEMPFDEAELRFGTKAANLGLLSQMSQDESAGFSVPEGIAVEPGTSRQEITDTVRSRFETEYGGTSPLIVRSSGRNEDPGQHSSIITGVRSYRSLKDIGDILSAYEQVTKPGIAAVIQNLAHGYSEISDNYGENDASFVAQSRSPINPDNYYIAAVNGLARPLLDGIDKGMIIEVNETTHNVASVLSMSDEALQNGFDNRDQLVRQRYMEVLDSRTLRVTRHSTEFSNFEPVFFRGFNYDFALRTMSPFRIDGRNRKNTELERLIAAMDFIKAEYGHEFEIEGTFSELAEGQDRLLNIVQIRQLEPRIESKVKVDAPADYTKLLDVQAVFGVADVETDMYVFDSHDWDEKLMGEMARIDAAYPEGNYVLVVPSWLHGAFFKYVPNNKILITNDTPNLASHANGLMRAKISRGEKVALGNLSQQKLQDICAQHPDRVIKKPSDKKGQIAQFKNVRFISNGREAAVFVPQARPSQPEVAVVKGWLAQRLHGLLNWAAE
jgi:hypothetical protein